jgi:hypothetical protein
MRSAVICGTLFFWVNQLVNTSHPEKYSHYVGRFKKTNYSK